MIKVKLMKTIYDFNYEQLQMEFAKFNYKKYRSDQTFKWLYRKRALSFDNMSDLPKEMIQNLKDNYCIMPLEVVEKFNNSLVFPTYDEPIVFIKVINELGNIVDETTKL